MARLVDALRYKTGMSRFGIFQCHNLSGRTMDLESKQPLKGTSASNIFWEEKLAIEEG